MKALRHSIVRVIAPRIYAAAYNYWELKAAIESGVPRPAILTLKGRKELVGAEIGVSEGENAESIMKTLDVKRLYLIDPYTDYVSNGRIFHPAASREIALARMKHYGSKVQFINLLAHEAIEQVEQLDFVYIDGSHDYACVKQDIQDCAPKLRTGGLLCGHDFSADCAGVIRAVTEYAVTNRLDLMVRERDWWIEKAAEKC